MPPPVTCYTLYPAPVHTIDTYKDTFPFPPHGTTSRLRIIIVSAGIAGLSAALGLHKAGHNVTVLERVREIAEVGAGIQMVPNAAPILGRFGVLEDVVARANVLERNWLRRYEDNAELGSAPLMPQVGEEYNAPLCVIHRDDLQSILLTAVRTANIDLRLNARGVAADSQFSGTVCLASGERLSADVVIAAGGIKSHLRHQIATAHGHIDHAQPTGDAAYRILIPKQDLAGDPEALALLNSNVGMRWLGPGGHIMAYPIKKNQIYNMVLLHPRPAGRDDDPDAESWTQQGSKEEMRRFYERWNPLVNKLLSYVPRGESKSGLGTRTRFSRPGWRIARCSWATRAIPCCPMWRRARHRRLRTQVFWRVLSLSGDDVDIPTRLKVYELVRQERAEKIQNSAAETRLALHLPDGEKHRQRDEAIRSGGFESGTLGG
ncbi:hypothetical protein BJX68DRAFT_252491 [Aspergillus pseudodeflectus]|uniref:FAD-binding domain-containing protein n=1 Tax=Aspergillus pseudodeflectus TaxID=176178 RepID=A0ABR4L562_9EURO